MKNKIIRKKRIVKKKVKRVKKIKPVMPGGGINCDWLSIQGNEEQMIMKPIPFEKSYMGTQMGYKEPVTRGELGYAPAHYANGKYTPWDIVDDWKLDYYCGNALKYVCRHKHKGAPVQDIQKAIDCLLKYKINLEKDAP